VGKSFLLRYQEEQVTPEGPVAHLSLATRSKPLGERPNRAASMGYETLSDPRRDMETSTAIRGEQPDRSAAGQSCAAIPEGAPPEIFHSLTYTFVRAEAPRKDELNRSALVLPRCS
jgi:hypothetical protein